MLTSAQMKSLVLLGWDFLPYAPNEWQWMKFNTDEQRIASQGDKVWRDDCDLLGIA